MPTKKEKEYYSRATKPSLSRLTGRNRVISDNIKPGEPIRAKSIDQKRIEGMIQRLHGPMNQNRIPVRCGEPEWETKKLTTVTGGR